MEKIYDVTALGEMLIDFAVNGESEQGNQLFEACPGGAPCNVLAMLNKLGRKTAFIGKVGDDQFGKLLRDTITNIGIEVKGLVMDQDIHTTLAFVHTFPDGDREFSFYRKPGADMMLKEEEVDYDLIRQSKVFHFGTLSMTDEPVKSATKKALAVAKEAGCMITFDPNLRPPLWKTLDEAKAQMEYGFENCDVLKISETTGAGDTFCGCSINGVLKYGLDNLDEAKLKEILTYANAGAALITMKKGAIRSMPEPENIKELSGK